MFINNELSMVTNKYTVGELSTPLAPPILTFLLICLKIKHFKCNINKKGYSNRVLNFGDILLKRPIINIIKPNSKGGRYYMLVSIPVELRKFFNGKRQIKRSCGSLREVTTYPEAVAVDGLVYGIQS